MSTSERLFKQQQQQQQQQQQLQALQQLQEHQALQKHQSQHYARIAQAIAYIQQRQLEQPSLADIAAHVHLSPDHLQRVFSQWVGTSPKKFLQYLTLEHVKHSFTQQAQQSILHCSYAAGLSSSSRLHELFVQIEGMTPAQYKHGGKGLEISYDFYQSPFGPLLLAATELGICTMAFYQDAQLAQAELYAQFSQAQFRHAAHPHHASALAIFNPEHHLTQMKLHLKGSAFQLKVWQCLLNIPVGQCVSYAAIATELGQPTASRAVGTAIGRNPVAYLIPCHRVIRATGHLGGYRWGLTRKQAMLAWEAAQSELML